jgi:riboflavin biosynthesis pyrimidine reductase
VVSWELRNAMVSRATSPEVDVRSRLTTVLGVDALAPLCVLHVLASARGPDARLHALRIGDLAPKSATDFFVLQASRARADAVLTSAENLRSEPELVHDFVGPHASGLADYRRRVLGLSHGLQVFVLSRSGELPLTHPVWNDGAKKTVLCPEGLRGVLVGRLPKHVEVVSLENLEPRAILAFLQREGQGRVNLEVGPSTAGRFYADHGLVDELWLSTYLAQDLPPEALAGALPDDATLFAGRERAHLFECVEPSGPWRFERYVSRGA